jgi:hypothetical protein
MYLTLLTLSAQTTSQQAITRTGNWTDPNGVLITGNLTALEGTRQFLITSDPVLMHLMQEKES